MPRQPSPRSQRFAILCVAFLIGLHGASAFATQETLTLVEIETDDAETVAQQLIDAGFGVEEGSVREGALEVVASEAELALLREMGFAPVVIARGRPFREIQSERAALASVAPPGYPEYDEIVAQMGTSAAAFPSISRLVDLTEHYSLPATFEGRHIFAVKISDNVVDDEDEPAFLIVSAHHGKEIVTPIIALHAIEQLTTLYGSDPTITAMVNQYEIWIAPVWNPDGYEYAFNFDNTWRKNRAVFPGGTGVELNRNYPFGWSSACSGPTDPASGSYKGPSPASEAETQTMLTLTDDRHFAKVLDFHSSGTEVLRGYHCLNHPFQSFLIDQAADLADAFGFGGRTRPPSAEGEHYEWQFAMRGAQANLVETRVTSQPPFESAQQEAIDLFPGILYSLQRPIMLGGHVTDVATGDPLVATLRYLEIPFENGETNSSGARFGRYHVFLPPDTVTVEFSAAGYVSQYHVVDIDPQAAQTLDVQLEPAALTMTLIQGPSGLLEVGSAPVVEVEITPGTENLVPGSATLFYRYDDGAFLSLPLAPLGGDLYSATLPTLDQCGDQHEYFAVAQGDAGTQVTLPDTAPGFVFDFDVGETQTLVAFDESWRYLKGTQEPSPGDLTAWTQIAFDDSAWQVGAGSFGYGSDCDPFGTVLDDMPGNYRSLYQRKLFPITDPGIVVELTLTADYDDSFVAYINGVEIARNNIAGNPPLFDALASSDHECSGSSSNPNPPAEFRIHDSAELTALLVAGDNVLAIQGHNLTDTSSDFTLEMTLSGVVCGCNDDADCDDGDPCNGVETCADDVCVPGVPVDCAPLICDPVDGSCVACLVDSDCDDLDVCNGQESCNGGACWPGSVLDCDDGVTCTDDACDPIQGCSNVDNCPGIELCNPGTGLCEEPTVEPLPVVEGDEWRYFKGTQEPSPGDLTVWTAEGFDDTAWLQGNSGFGYGVDCSAGTPLGEMQNSYSSLYLRRLFLVDNPAALEELTLTLDYDDAFVAYINGVEVARNNVVGTPPTYATLAQVDHECSGSAGAANPPESHALHLVFDLNDLLQPGINVLAIQGHNLTLGSSDFTLLPTLSAVEAEPCIDPAECGDGDLCTVDDCVAGVCVNTPINCPAGEVCNPGSGQCELQITVSFQEGLAGYAGTLDTFIQEEPTAANNDNGTLEALNWDADDPQGSGYSTLTLVRFENIFGDGASQVPAEASIRWATLSYTVGGDSNAPGDDGELHEILVPWAESVSWNSLGGSPGAAAGDDYAVGVAGVLTGAPAGTHFVDVTASLQAWSDNPSANLGWIVVPTNTNGVDVRSSEYVADPLARPQLDVTFVQEAECIVDADCDDGDACNGLETCESEQCVAGTPLDCDNGDACDGAESCDPVVGCVAGTPPQCDDGDACNGLETCDSATGCVAGTPLDCNDGDACTQDSCDPASGCEYEPVVCDDGDACNGVESCDPVVGCVAGTPPQCDDGDACNGLETCDSATGCVAGTPLDCNDGDACTQDSCDPAGGCEYEPVVCDDGDACNGVESCDPVVGCVAGTPPQCDDGDACNGLETCDSATGCVAGTPLDCNDGDACTQDSCDPASGCEYEPVVCDDGDACNGVESCDPVVGCVAGTPPQCDDGDACNGLETCDSATGCVAGTPLDCNDGDACTQDSCDPASGCEYEPVVCDDGDACNGVESCDPVVGCVAGTPPQCDDGDACNGLETCDSATGCVAGTPLDCNDGDACTQDSCDPASGCEYEPVICDDGDACNGVESCDPVVGCVAGTPPQCDDGVFCNGLESCDPAVGCVAGAPPDCDDGDSCTVDTCDDGTDECAHLAPPVPAEVQGLRLGKTSPGSAVAVLVWTGDPIATSYNVYRGSQADLEDLSCWVSNVLDISTTDDGHLAPLGSVLRYLTSAVNCRGESTLGEGRANPDPCP